MDEVRIIEPTSADLKRWRQLFEAGGSDNFFMHPEVFSAFSDKIFLLIHGDFDFVLPLSARKKFCIPYLHQLPFVQRLSAVGNMHPDSVTATAAALKNRFPLIHIDTDIPFNNLFQTQTQRRNYILSLAPDYRNIYESCFTTECRKNIAKANNRGCILKETKDWHLIIHNYHKVYGTREGNHLKQSYTKALSFLNRADESCEGYLVTNAKNEVLFSGIIVKGSKRIYYWLGSPTAAGRAARATYYFISEIIRKYSSSGFTFDFEGSDFPTVAKFYNSFTPQWEPYFEVKHRWI